MTLTHEGPHQLSDGRPARVLCWDLKCNDGLPIVVVFTLDDGSEGILRFREDGTQPHISARLIDAPKRRSVWANVYEDCLGDGRYSSRQDADRACNSFRTRRALLELIYEGDKPVQAVLHDAPASPHPQTKGE